MIAPPSTKRKVRKRWSESVPKARLAAPISIPMKMTARERRVAKPVACSGVMSRCAVAMLCWSLSRSSCFVVTWMNVP